MDLGLNEKVAWVHGASGGLGRASATSLAAAGARVVVSSRNAEALEKTAQEISAETNATVMAVPVDVTDPDAIMSGSERVRTELGGVDILVANAGGPPPGGFAALDEAALFDAFTLTTASAWRLAKAVVGDMQAAGGGVLVFLTSGSTKEIIPSLLLSNMMRAAVVGLAKTLSKELASDGIRALCVAPGRIATQRLVQLDQAAAERTGTTADEVRASNIAAIPLGRYGDPREFGDVVAFLASERASYVSGISVSVDGGALNGLLS